jgi:hypothetical protein
VFENKGFIRISVHKQDEESEQLRILLYIIRNLKIYKGNLGGEIEEVRMRWEYRPYETRKNAHITVFRKCPHRR